MDNRIPSHLESNNVIISKTHSEQVGKVLDRIMVPSDPEAHVNQASDLFSAKETVLLLGLCSSRLILLLKWELWMNLFSAEVILASSTSKFGIEIPRIDDEVLNSSTKSTISTSLIHSTASAGNCEQIHTSVLNFIFQQSKGC